jgi:RNA polymerase sigma-70 factor (ECF subfamily)
LDTALPYDEQLLLKQISEGDEAAFNIIFSQYRERLFAYLFTITKSKETTEEIVLDVFMKLWLGREIVTEIQNLQSFLYRVAHNKAIDFLRSAQRSPVQQNDIWEAIQSTAGEASSDHLLHRHNTETALNEAIEQLSPMRQKVFQLSREEGMSYDQIADHLNLSRNTVRNHVAASLEFIRKYLQDKGYDMAVVAVIISSSIVVHHIENIVGT